MARRRLSAPRNHAPQSKFPRFFCPLVWTYRDDARKLRHGAAQIRKCNLFDLPTNSLMSTAICISYIYIYTSYIYRYTYHHIPAAAAAAAAAEGAAAVAVSAVAAAVGGCRESKAAAAAAAGAEVPLVAAHHP